MTHYLAVFGNPIAHSRSPAIHHAFATQFSLDVQYDKLLAPKEGFAEAVAEFFQQGGEGANVTLPFKQEAFALCDQLSDRAAAAGAVNTLWQKEGKLQGDNTDGVGLVTDMQTNLGWSLAGKRLLVLGAGGAVRGILKPLQQAGVSHITVANRTLSRAEQLADDMAAHDVAIKSLPLTAIDGSYDVVINAISAGLQGEQPDLPGHIVTPATHCYDLVYADEPTPFLRWAKAQNVTQLADGLGMLVEQAATSFAIWLQQRPTTAVVIQQLRQQL